MVDVIGGAQELVQLAAGKAGKAGTTGGPWPESHALSSDSVAHHLPPKAAAAIDFLRNEVLSKSPS